MPQESDPDSNVVGIAVGVVAAVVAVVVAVVVVVVLVRWVGCRRLQECAMADMQLLSGCVSSCHCRLLTAVRLCLQLPLSPVDLVSPAVIVAC